MSWMKIPQESTRESTAFVQLLTCREGYIGPFLTTHFILEQFVFNSLFCANFGKLV
jgi:hypothetical protein